MEARNKKSMFLALYIFILIFMLFGIAFSYFTARTRSENNALNIKSGRLALSLEIESKYTGNKLIPTDDADIMKAYHNGCRDDLGRQACAAYKITVANGSAKQDVVGSIDFTIDHIANLSYLVLDENENFYQNITKIEKSSQNMPLGSNFILDSALETNILTKREFMLLIWLSNYDYNQKEDMGGAFSASIKYNSVYGQSLSTVVTGSKEGGN